MGGGEEMKYLIKELISAKEEEIGRKITQQEIADETGVSPSTISKLGLEKPPNTSADKLEALCRYFRVPIKKLAVVEFDDIEEKEVKISELKRMVVIGPGFSQEIDYVVFGENPDKECVFSGIREIPENIDAISFYGIAIRAIARQEGFKSVMFRFSEIRTCLGYEIIKCGQFYFNELGFRVHAKTGEVSVCGLFGAECPGKVQEVFTRHIAGELE